MFNIVLILVLTFGLLATMFVWVPLHSAEVSARRNPGQRTGEVPDLREDDASPQFTGKIA